MEEQQECSTDLCVVNFPVLYRCMKFFVNLNARNAAFPLDACVTSIDKYG